MKRINTLIVLLLILMIGLLTGCINNAKESITKPPVNQLSGQEREINVDKLEVYHFHGTHQCYSCITVGDYAEDTVQTYFKDELDKGIIVFDHINGDLTQNRDVVTRYGATGSSLWIGTYKGDEFKAEENVNVWYKIRDKEDYMNYLKGVIEQKLSGN